MDTVAQVRDYILQITENILYIDSQIEKHISTTGLLSSGELITNYLTLLASIKNDLMDAYSTSNYKLDEGDLCYAELCDHRERLEAKWLKLNNRITSTSVREMNAANACDALYHTESKHPIKIGRIAVWSIVLFIIYFLIRAAFN